MKHDSFYLIVYDVTDDKERRKVSLVLEAEGFRVQKSVFECRMTKSTVTRLVNNLEKLHLQTGGVRVYRSMFPKPEYTVAESQAPHKEEDFALVV